MQAVVAGTPGRPAGASASDGVQEFDVARDTTTIETRGGMIQRLRWPLLIGGPVVVLALVAWFVLTGGRYQSTDDAYVQAARTAVSASISGRIVDLEVHDNQPVKAGQVLFRLDDRDYKNALAQAEAQLAVVRLQVQTERASSGQQAAAVEVAQTAVAYADKRVGARTGTGWRRRRLSATAGPSGRRRPRCAGPAGRGPATGRGRQADRWRQWSHRRPSHGDAGQGRVRPRPRSTKATPPWSPPRTAS